MTKYNNKNSLASSVVLIILDGWGYNPKKNYNAIASANTPIWDNLIKTAITTKLEASGEAVGLPHGQMGNSEVGHIAIGAGRIIEQDLVRINKSIDHFTASNSSLKFNAGAGEDFFNNKILLKNITHTINLKKNIHILGLLSDGGIHSHDSHLYALLKMISIHNTNNTNILIHAFLDGRDTPPKSSVKYLTTLEKTIKNNDNITIATICGRFFAMDRDNRFERTEKVYNLLTSETSFTAITALDGLQQAYDRLETDEFVSPTRINQSPPIADGDLVIFYNFRTDRTRQLSEALTKVNFSKFKRKKFPIIKLVTFTKYSEDISADIVFPPILLNNVLSAYLASKHLTQLKIAETEKYPHVTFFFNGGQEICFPLEDRILIPSPKVKTYDLTPEMSAIQITDELINAINQKKYAFIACNFANADMVGHTGDIPATITAIETLDNCLGRIIASTKNTNIDIIITADHGNAELMYDIKNKQPLTSHTNLPVPFVYFGTKKVKLNLPKHPSLQDIAPTILTLLQIDKPVEMTGNSLLAL